MRMSILLFIFDNFLFGSVIRKPEPLVVNFPVLPCHIHRQCEGCRNLATLEVSDDKLRSGKSATDQETKYEGFSKDVCRSMIALLDVDRSGKLGFEEFKKLWIDIKDWKAVFKLYDKDNTGYLSPFELRQALNSAGYHINCRILNVLSHRYASKDGKIAFDDFMMCAVRLKTMIEIFNERSSGQETASFSLPEWIETTLYS